MISLDVLLDGITVNRRAAGGQSRRTRPAERLRLGRHRDPRAGRRRARVLLARRDRRAALGDAAHPTLARRGGDQGARVARNLIRATYRGSVGLFDTLREPLSQPLGGADQIRCSFEEMLDELLAPLLGDHRLGRVITAMQERPQQAEALGHSPMEFLQTIRLDRAARLLTSTDLPVKGIARQVGYVSRSSFTRAFVAAHGRGPMAFRAAARRPLAAADAWAPLLDRRRRAGLDTAFIGRMNPYIEGPTC